MPVVVSGRSARQYGSERICVLLWWNPRLYLLLVLSVVRRRRFRMSGESHLCDNYPLFVLWGVGDFNRE